MKRSWSEDAARQLAEGSIVQVRPAGDSMTGRINNGDAVTLAPCNLEDIQVGDVVLVRIRLRRSSLIVLHLVLDKQKGHLLIGNNHGRVDGWVEASDIYGKVTSVESKIK